MSKVYVKTGITKCRKCPAFKDMKGGDGYQGLYCKERKRILYPTVTLHPDCPLEDEEGEVEASINPIERISKMSKKQYDEHKQRLLKLLARRQ